MTRFNRAGFISENTAVEVGGAIGVHIKSSLFMLVKSNNLVFSAEPIFTIKKQETKQNKKRLVAGIFNFFVFFSFRANERQNKTNKKYTKQDNNKVK